MPTPTIGEVITPELEKERRQVTKELAQLESGAKESIFSLIFEAKETGSSANNEQ